MTIDQAKTAYAFVLQIQSAVKIMAALDSAQPIAFGPALQDERWQLPAEAIAVTRRTYEKIKAYAENELAKM